MDDFYNKCLTSSIEKICYFGYFFLLFGIILFLLNIYAVIKMTIYYGKMNFENTILLLSSIQSLLLIIQMITSYNYFISIFLFIQILAMCLINNKFKKISEGYIDIKYTNVTKIIIVINIVYLIVFNIIYKFITTNHLFYSNIVYYLLEIGTSFFLAYHCRIFLDYIKQDTSKDKKKPPTNENVDINKKPPERKISDKGLIIITTGDELFYLIKKRQLTLLYLSNIICSFLEFLFEFILNFMNPNENSFYLVNYLYHFIFFIHNSIIFICFYWIVREQYSSNLETNIIGNKEEKKEKLIDNQFIKEEKINIKEENERITGYLNDDKALLRKTSTESSEGEDKNKGKENEVNKKGIVRKISRNDTFDENEEITVPNLINIEDLPSNENDN